MELHILQRKNLPAKRDDILAEQSGKCLVCGKECLSPVLDHHHKKRVGGSGQIRGVLCRGCNVFLGKIENNCSRYGISGDDLPNILRNIADYLEREQYPLLHPSEAPPTPKLKKSSYNKLKKELGSELKVPEYPASGKLTKRLMVLFQRAKIEPKFYK